VRLRIEYRDNATFLTRLARIARNKFARIVNLYSIEIQTRKESVVEMYGPSTRLLLKRLPVFGLFL